MFCFRAWVSFTVRVGGVKGVGRQVPEGEVPGRGPAALGAGRHPALLGVHGDPVKLGLAGDASQMNEHVTV